MNDPEPRRLRDRIGTARGIELVDQRTDMELRRMHRDPQPPRHLLGLEAAGEQGDDLGLALGQPGRPLDPWDALPGRLQHGADTVHRLPRLRVDREGDQVVVTGLP